MPSSPYTKFPVNETIDLKETSNIRQIVDTMVEAYLSQEPLGKFSYRILLPRDQKSTIQAKRLGLAFQGEFILGLRRRNVVPIVREVRYVHDEHHYGWLLANPQVFDQFEKRL
ncbi:MAG: hypothetical protein M3247_06865 [Thermoproteota archaeon]|nr:hypothetical protein [Thermoproteota archaeon]